jgi:hypothetical protein
VSEVITEEWLKEVGFKWHQFDRQPNKHWLLWLGDALADASGYRDDTSDLGIELARSSFSDREYWFCWLRSDTAHRYSRFLHVRHVLYRDDLIRMIEGLTGRTWNPANHFYGCMKTTEQAARLRADHDRLDRRLLREGAPWGDHEKDDTRGGALPEHMKGKV